MNQLPDAARETALEAEDAAKESARGTTDAARDIYLSVAAKAEETLATSKEYVRRNPVPVLLGAIAFGAAIGCMVMMARRKPTFGERYVGEPMDAVREAVLGALAPATRGVSQGYDSARDRAGKVINRVHHFRPGRAADSFSDQIGRIGNNLKFW